MVRSGRSAGDRTVSGDRIKISVGRRETRGRRNAWGHRPRFSSVVQTVRVDGRLLRLTTDEMLMDTAELRAHFKGADPDALLERCL